ncbi:MAG: FIST C-terminal domain-containing protein [Synergistaceae bacterium]|jgi:hypothetical protein|nr:FIST C-terminal domain-containing protein [Synergistaceae bacterium]
MMLKMRNAYTSEIDDADAAVADILGQIDLKEGVLKNSVGILACNGEYVEVGAVEEICKRLPFEVIGCTTLGSAACGAYGPELLCLTILTSDDVTFSTVCTAPLVSGDAAEVRNSLKEAYDEARAKLSGDPSLIFAILPILTEVGGSTVLKELDGVSGGIPIFGTLSSDQSVSYQESRTIYNGASHQYSAAMILARGDVNPKFHITALPEKNIQKQKAIITESEGCLLKRINDMPLLDYLATLGLTKESGLEATNTVPFLVDYGLGTSPVALGMYKITDEGYAVCGGEMPVGATLSIGMIDYEGIMETAALTVENALNRDEINGLLMFPCLTRNHMLSPNSMDEMKKVNALISQKVPYMLCYSGGEICPVYGEDGKLYNRFHNYTFTACVF